ncbi:GPI ethanolamine phosphate transferase 2 [Dothidotthia symphoricarpi CBS 119687]|uniref:GPI ethanolamine phosphate transferase 2 n=1 Tax=Dothidotthia symphoricarpi CBS 119687 TaxID=1392245 RepID=A0A6A6AC40_9PLEO|nr:GPI ethanolamine phosphate transferase 2 [Dothidotthia symphoricarpi CBS 119687]KAF2128574.1 GPI ethanolamine phosphate transferase 2 [Dothidotthia symphoricarpi CBS 119687]
MAPRTTLLALANLLIPVAILVFATGFFPYKPFMPGLAEYEELGWNTVLGKGWQEPPKAPFDKLVFMVVDALRSDFVYGEESGMSFVQSLIRDGTALPFTAHATSPTITMPRVKAITTGSIPSFLDVILNFAESDTSSSLATQDTWLAQIRAKQFDGKNGNLVMYGDDTWLKLFPDFFTRADGTSSFFVSDFTEVDNNVTRHVPGELLNSDWNAMILHYLGLDHIGHKAGPKSPNMIPKQKEMDDMVQTIYGAIENEDHLSNTLLVLCGDHGMNDGGNHGGSSPGETSPALVFMSPKLAKITGATKKESPVRPKNEGEFEYYRMVEQSDIAPTLAGLLGFPVPKNNLGVFLEEFLGFWDKIEDRVQILYRNAKQIKKIVGATYTGMNFDDKVLGADELGFDCFSPGETSLTDGQALACLWQRAVNAMGTDRSVIDHLYKFMHESQEAMSSTASNYDVVRLVLGTSLSLLICVLSYLALPPLRSASSAGLYYTLILILYSILMFASSYVEEEHNFWYWATSAWFFHLFITSMRKQWFSKWIFHPAIMALALHRVIRRWNQTGQKYAGADDIVTSGVFHGHGSTLLWLLVGATYVDVTLRLSRHVARSVATFDSGMSVRAVEIESTDSHRMVGTVAVLPLSCTAFIFKLAFTAKDAPELTQGITGALMEWIETLDLVVLAQTVFGGIALVGSWIAFAEWKRSQWRAKRKREGHGEMALAFFDLTTLFLLTQTKAHNIPLYLLFRLQFLFLSLLDLPKAAVTTITLLLAQTSFFALGNSNAISSIDLSNSYNGVSTYNVLAVGLLVFLSNWAGPVWWSLAGMLMLNGRKRTVQVSTSRDWVAEERIHLTRLARGGDDEARTQRKGDERVWMRHVALMTLWTGVMLAAVMAACTALRTHLFIWTVFSPKYLFAMAWGVAWHLGVTVGLGGLVWWLGTW